MNSKNQESIEFPNNLTCNSLKNCYLNYDLKKLHVELEVLLRSLESPLYILRLIGTWLNEIDNLNRFWFKNL